MRAVVSQPMYFPWVGLLEQIWQADVFVHYDDVQFTRGFFNRVQIKTPERSAWLTIPLQGQHRGQLINDCIADESRDWRTSHRDALARAYRGSPGLEAMMDVFDRGISPSVSRLSEISIHSMAALANFFGVGTKCRYLRSSELGIGGSGSARLLAICKAVGADTYVTGHGARNYLDHPLFEQSGVTVEYMNYRCVPYPQLHGEFTPFVSALDLVANRGLEGRDNIISGTKPWREFLDGPN